MLNKSTLRLSFENGLVMGITAIFVILIGMPQSFSGRNLLDGFTLNMGVFVILGLLTGYLLRRKLDTSFPLGPKITLAGLSGAVSGGLVAGLLLLLSQVDLRSVFVNATPELVSAVAFGQGVWLGAGLQLGLFISLAIAAIILAEIPSVARRAILNGVGAVFVLGLFWVALTGLEASRWFFYYTGLSATEEMSVLTAFLIFAVVATFSYFSRPIRQKSNQNYQALPQKQQLGVKIGLFIVLMVFLLFLPWAVGRFWAQTLTTIGLFTLMGLGLNIEIGLAGLLDLGMVAFYAIGAYTVALFTSAASSLALGWSFWAVLPVAMFMAAVFGVLLGIPVLRLRGDYLAIVTLGLGEITRLLLNADIFKPYLGGPQGILETPAPVFFGFDLKDPRLLYYLILAACLLVIFLSVRLNNSRIGRAWMAIREDEDVAQAMGINLVAAKLMAFGIGAAFAGVGGAIFATRQGAIFPSDFTLFISINVLCLIIIGGIGNTMGVILGAFFLVGLPEVLRELDEYRILFYGAGLVIMMIARPEGILPSARRKLELHAEDGEVDPTDIPKPAQA
jgi:branched-chain amino acid transport system permease protein